MKATQQRVVHGRNTTSAGKVWFSRNGAEWPGPSDTLWGCCTADATTAQSGSLGTIALDMGADPSYRDAFMRGDSLGGTLPLQ
ncbi:hypothetical protein, partial [Cognatishimia sp. F0-27]|uniref:hypothetical protein n=1 Tax=Cognatishimia sp. F0-27 TaxID=2816855 RepID=UPI001D0C25D2